MQTSLFSLKTQYIIIYFTATLLKMVCCCYVYNLTLYNSFWFPKVFFLNFSFHTSFHLKLPTPCNIKKNSHWVASIMANSHVRLSFFTAHSTSGASCLQRHHCYINHSPACRALSLEGQPTKNCQDGKWWISVIHRILLHYPHGQISAGLVIVL